MDELQKILETAEVLFRKYGIRSVTMSDIARQLGISKKTLYVHIENKNDLINKIMAAYIGMETEMCNIACDNAKDALDEMIEISLQVQQNIQNMNPSLIFDLRKYHYPIWEQFELFRTHFILDMMRNNLDRGQKEGLYRSELKPDIVSRLYIGTVQLFTDDEMFPADAYPRDVLHKEMVMYHLNGIVSEQGKSLLNTYIQRLNNHSIS